MNIYFAKIAHWTAGMENHKNQRQYNNSVFIKRFIFEFTDFQLYLFYIGIYQLDIRMLRVNLVSVFMVDEVRRILLEAILPYLTQNKDEISKDVQATIKKARSTLSKGDTKVDDSVSTNTTDSKKSKALIAIEIID